MKNESHATHKAKMEKLKKNVDASITAATTDKGVGILLTGYGSGKSMSAVGMMMRALGYGYKVAIIQFLKGEQSSGEEKFIQEKFPEMLFHQMKTGYTWDTQDKEKDKAAAISSWKVAKKALADESLHLVVLDELTYMLSFKYLDESEVIQALNNRPKNQSVVITGRGGGKKLKGWADTVSEVRNIKHAFNSQIMARKGVDY